MKQRQRSNIDLFIFITSITLIWTVIAYVITSNQMEELTNAKYLEVSQTMHNRLTTLIEEKKEANQLIAFSLAQNDKVQKALLTKNIKDLHLEEFARQLSEHTVFKNIWLQVLTTKGDSFYRSWTSDHGDNITKLRLDVQAMISKPRVINSISVGKFDLTFKAMVPIYFKDQFIGSVESIAKFNSIALKMRQQGYDMAIIVDKRYKEQLTHPFSKLFVDDHYIANTNAKKSVLDFLHKEHVEHFFNKEPFHIHEKENILVTTYHLYDTNNRPIAYFVLFHALDTIDLSEQIRSRDRTVLLFITVYALFLMLLYYLYVKRYRSFLQKMNLRLEETIEEKTHALQEQTKTLDYLAHHDALTGLPNRLFFLERLNKSISQAKREQTQVTVMFLDLDRFKEINDTFGHDVGDSLLKIVAKRLKNCLRSDVLLARLGGDEFTILLEDHSAAKVLTILDTIILQMKSSIAISEHRLYTTFSIGLSSFPEDGHSTDILLRNADTAMYRAKHLGKNTFQFYNATMTQEAVERVELEHRLRRALRHDEFIVYFQPQIDALDHRVIGMEALVRWNDPEKGMISPAEFIPFAEEVGLIIDIDDWMFKASMRQLSQWHKEKVTTAKLSLNLSMRQLENEHFFEHLKTLLQSLKCDARYLEFEITESLIMNDPSTAIELLNHIKSLGISIAIDDFGTGYSSLSYLKRLPIDKLKIDKSFIDDLPNDEEDIAIVRSIIALAKSLRLDIIAEGVETQEQNDFLIQEGCTNIQGHYYARPMPADACKAFLLQWKEKHVL